MVIRSVSRLTFHFLCTCLFRNEFDAMKPLNQDFKNILFSFQGGFPASEERGTR